MGNVNRINFLKIGPLVKSIECLDIKFPLNPIIQKTAYCHRILCLRIRFYKTTNKILASFPKKSISLLKNFEKKTFSSKSGINFKNSPKARDFLLFCLTLQRKFGILY